MLKQHLALLVMPLERRAQLLNHLVGIEVDIMTASSCSEAAGLLRAVPAFHLVLTDLALPDGGWFDVLNLAADINPDLRVVVCARLADERLWSQILEAGAFDILVEPYQDAEVARIVCAASTAALQGELAAAG